MPITLLLTALLQAGATPVATAIRPRITDPVIRTIPKSQPPLGRVGPRRVDMLLTTLPESMIEFGRNPEGNWLSVDRRPPGPPGGIAPSGGTLYVMHRSRPLPKSCSIGPDRIDLSPLHRNGFVPVKIERASLHAPGMNDRDPVPVRSSMLDANGKPTMVIADVHTIVQSMVVWGVSSPPGVDRVAPFQLCSAGYRIDITVRGPEGINPLTGQPIVRRPVN